jgi:hypothetical protein
MPLKRVWIPSPNYSSRNERGVRLIVLHTAEGARTIESLGSFFQGNVQASSHVGADDKVNTIGEYVRRQNKSWTQSDFNAVAVSIELCAFAAWTTAEWNKHPNMLQNCASWIAEEAAHFGIPIRRLAASDAQAAGRGVCQHSDLGPRGGGHHDCGSGFPMDRVLDMARGGAGPTPTPTQEDTEMVASGLSDGGVLHVWWVVSDKQTVRYRYQRAGENNWVDGGVFTKADKAIAGLSATLTASGTLELFCRYADGNISHTWQKKGSTEWAGGQAGKFKAAFTPLPA